MTDFGCAIVCRLFFVLVYTFGFTTSFPGMLRLIFFFAFAYFFLYSTLNASNALKCVPNEMHINTKFMEADAIVIYTLAFSSKPKEMIQEFGFIHFTSEHTTIWTVCL